MSENNEIFNNDICYYCQAEIDDSIDCAGMANYPQCFVGRKLYTVNLEKSLYFKYICTDCTIGEKKPCVWECIDPEDKKPVSCPLGTHGEDAQWRLAEELKLY